MKNENYNVIIKTLDDQTVYKEICRRLREIEQIRFHCLWIVPLVSGGIIMLLWLEEVHIPVAISCIVSLLGALVTFFIFRWEKYNMQISDIFRHHAALLENRKNQQENLDTEGPYSGIIGIDRPFVPVTDMPGESNDKSAYRRYKDSAENAVYLSTIILWLLTIILSIVKLYAPVNFLAMLFTN